MTDDEVVDVVTREDEEKEEEEEAATAIHTVGRDMALDAFMTSVKCSQEKWGVCL